MVGERTSEKTPRNASVSNTISAARGANDGRTAVRPSHEDIANRARALWQAKGCPAGKDEENWLEAEKQLRNGR